MSTEAATETQGLESGLVDDATLMQELAGLDAEPEAPAEPEKEEPAPDDPVEAEPESDEEAGPEDEPQDEPEEAADDEPEKSEDPELQKRLEALQRQEKRQKDSIDRHRAEVEAKLKQREAELERQWGPKLEAAQAYQEALERAAYDPAGLLMAAGVKKDDLEAAARAIYKTAKGGTDAADEMRSRKAESKLEQLERELRAMKEQQAQREAQAEAEQQKASYISSIEKATGDETPIVSTMLERAPEKARTQLWATAERLYQQTGEPPDPSDVVRELEKEFADLGVAPAAGKKAAPKTTTPATAGETKTAKTLSNQMSTPTKPRQEPESEEDLDAEILAALQSGKLE